MGGDCLSYPVIYAETATDFFNLGLGTLPDATKVEVTEERNGEFTLSMTYLVDGLRANEIKKNRIIKVDAGHVLKGQRFVIKKINRQLVDKQLQLQVYAEHVSYITNDLQLKPNVSVNGSGDAAIKAWRSNIIDVNPLVVDSDIETNTSTTWTIDKVQSARQALGGVSGSLLDLWGGEYRFDNYHISLKKQRGTVANTLLSYGRNITDFDQEENITDTYTTVYPYATYTETTTADDNASSESKLMTLPELTVDSEYVGNYPNRKILPVDLTSKFTDNEKPTIEKLREYAKAYVKSNSIGIPTVSIKLSYVDLSQSSNYEALKLLEVLDLCDTVPVRFSKLGVDTKTKVSRVVWDVLAEHYTSMELGDTRYTIGDMINNALNTANEANQNSQDAQNSANHAVVSADGHTMIFYGPNTPIAKNIGDLWYEPDGEYETMYRWDGTVWAFVMSTRDTADAKEAADKAHEEAEEAQKKANESVATANDAVAKAGFANDTATQAKSDAATALQKALDAYAHGDQIKNGLTVDLDAVKGQVALKASQIDVDKLGGRVDSAEAQIKLQADQIALSVSKTELTNVLGSYATQTWTQGQIKTTADQIKLSVSQVQSTVDNLSAADRNLILGSASWKNLGFWEHEGGQPSYNADASEITTTSIAGGAYIHIEHLSKKLPNPGDDVIVSVEAKGTGTLRLTYLVNGTLYEHSDQGLTTVFKRYYLRLKWQSGTSYEIAFYNNDAVAKSITLRRPKVAASSVLNSDWSPAPEDYVDNVEFANLEVKFNGIQATVQSKADKSQVTQLADQITSTISSLGVSNMLQNSEFVARDITPWSSAHPEMWSVGWNNYDVYQGSNVLHFSRAMTETPIWVAMESEFIEVYAGQVISVSTVAYHTGGTETNPKGNFFPEIDFYKDKNSSRIEYHGGTSFNVNDPYAKQTLVANNIVVPAGVAYVRFAIQTYGTGNLLFAHPMLTKQSTALPYKAANVSQSQITQTVNMINLRVEKDKVVNQINVSTEGILIDGSKVHITGLTWIDNAVIKDAMIANVKADKITAGTLNAANVNVINLNANNITTGTLKGSNLSLNLNTGEILFQRGSIKSTNGKLNININDGTLAVLSNNNSGVLFDDGNLYLSTVVNGIFTPGVDKPKYGSITYVNDFLNNHPGMAVTGAEGLLLLNGKDIVVGSIMQTYIANGLGILLGKDNIYMGGGNNTGGTYITGGVAYDGYLMGEIASVSIGTGDTKKETWVTGQSIELDFAPGKIMTTDLGGKLRLSRDDRNQYIMSANTYNRTYSSGATMTITDTGIFGRISSASKYKLAIGEITTLNSEAHQFLSVRPKQWFDKSESEMLADMMTTGNADYVDDVKALPHTGFIAEDLYTAGLDSYVLRGRDGSIESIQYDRLPVLHHELIRELFNRLDAAEIEIFKLKQGVKNAS